VKFLDRIMDWIVGSDEIQIVTPYYAIVTCTLRGPCCTETITRTATASGELSQAMAMSSIRNHPDFAGLASRGWIVHVELVGVRAYLEASRVVEDGVEA